MPANGRCGLFSDHGMTLRGGHQVLESSSSGRSVLDDRRSVKRRMNLLYKTKLRTSIYCS